MTQPDWDDDRLAAAFHARFDRPAPTDPGPRRPRRDRRDVAARFAVGASAGVVPAGIAAAAVVVVLVGSVAGRPGRHSVASAAARRVRRIATSTDRPRAPPTEQAVPGSVFEPPDHHGHRRHRDPRRRRGRPRARGPGLVHAGRRSVSCGPAPTAQPVSPVQLRLRRRASIWLTRGRGVARPRDGDRSTWHRPTGPALNPDLDGLDPSWQPADLGIGADGDSTPIDVVFVGHFDDRRAALCPEAEQTACRDRFVVDAVASVAGRPPPRSVVARRRLARPRPSRRSRRSSPTRRRSRRSCRWSSLDGSEGLASHRAVARRPVEQGLDRPARLWVVRVLESERVVTYVVVDGTDAIYEMNPEGEAILVGGATADPVRPPARPGHRRRHGHRR